MNTKIHLCVIFFAFGLLLSSAAYSQSTTLVLQPGPTEAYDGSYGNNPDYLGIGSNSLLTDLGTTQWTCGGVPCELRSLIKFDLNSIPTNALISSATLSLSANPAQLNGNPEAGPTYGTDNASFLYPITSNWNFSTVSWNNQPNYTNINATVIPQSLSNYDDYNALDVTAAVQSMVSNPASNFGWMLITNTQDFYNCMIFCSGDYPDATKRPKLTILYESSLSINHNSAADERLVLSPNPTQTDLNLGFNSSYLGKLTINILNLMGQVIYKQNAEKTAFSFNKDFNVSGYSKGLYLIQVISPTETFNKRFYVN